MRDDRTLVRLAWAALGVVLAFLAASLVLALLGRTTPLPAGWPSWREQVFYLVSPLGASVLGWFVATRRPRNIYGWLWMGIGLGLSLLLFGQVYAAYGLLVSPAPLPLGRWFGTVGAGLGWTLWLVMTPLTLLVFPTGRVPSRRWRPLVGVVLAFGLVCLASGPFIPGRSGFAPIESPLALRGVVGGAMTALAYGSTLVVLATVPLAALSLVFRFRRSTGVERQQIKWFAYATALFLVEMVLQFFYEPPGDWDAVVETLPLLGLYAAIGIAILRHGLFDIDLIINRTLVYGFLTLSLVLVYLGSVVSLQGTLRALAGGESQLAVVASTLVIAALFNPLRRRTQDLVDRRFYRSRYDARRTLEAFSSRLRRETDLGELGESLSGVVRETLAPEHVSLWLRTTGHDEGRGP